jgi:hypothetical protein
MDVRVKRTLVVAMTAVAALGGGGGGCTCQRSENIAAKERLTKPQPKELSSTKATEPIDVDGLTVREKLDRVVHMDGSEVAARLGSFVYTSRGELSFGREREDTAALRSAEDTKVVQSDSGDFSIDVVTGDGSEQKLAYVNEVFFLKNNNGQWRVSRDPSGERNVYRSDAMGVWASFYDLVSHALVVERTGATNHAGRGAIGYRLTLPDQSAQARQEGATVTDAPAPPTIVPGVDGGPDTTVEAPEAEDARRERIAQRVAMWTKRAKPAGGAGRLLVDEATGVPVLVEFTGTLVVGDGANPAKLSVKLEAAMSEIGKAQTLKAPQDAIDEIVRRKMPASPRAVFEDHKVVEPLPEEEGAPKRKKKGTTAAPTELPEDE